MKRKIVPVNASDRTWTRRRFILAMGCYHLTTPIYLMIWANSLDNALDEAIDWLVEHAPGLLADDRVQEEYERGIANGLSVEAAIQDAEVDTTCGGNAGNRIDSQDWTIVAENPSRKEILELQGRA